MVLASNEWLRNSGDEQKTQSGVTSSTPILNVEREITTKNEQDLLKVNTNSNSMTTPNASCEIEVKGTTDDKEIKTVEKSAKLNENANTECEKTAPQGFEEEQEQQKSFSRKIQKAMASNNSSSDYATNNDGIAFQSELETSRTAIPNVNDEQAAEIVELENNNRTYASFIDEIIVSGVGSVGGVCGSIEIDPTDSNTNTLNADLTSRNSATTLSASDVLSSQQTLCKNEREPAFMSSLTIANANTAQTIAMNNANALSSNRLVLYGAEPSTGRSATASLLHSSGSNSGNNSVRNKNTNSNINLIPQTNATDINGDAKIVLICEKTSHPFETRTISLTPNIECKVGRLIAKCKPSESNAIFDCKVLSRNHAVLWFSNDGKFWVKDTNSSNGTFINDKKLDKDAAELHYGDIVKFGVDVLENSRKEVHGCIIACVKLYLPDGREAISIDNASPRSQFSGDSCISFDDLHRLNVYMQETSQREKALKSKLYNIQNILDATRKNSSTCWSAMISEDQLLHRIHSLEKKLQILEKNMPESALKNEIMKLIDDKNAYQHSAKEALRSVYVERCEAMQKLAKLESEFVASENECKILREQITSTEDSFQDANERLRLMEEQYNNYRVETVNQHAEAKMELEQHIDELTQKIQERETECEMLRAKMSELLDKRAQERSSESLGGIDEEKLQNQAIENFDAVIANMDIGDDDDDDEDEDEEDAVDEDVANAVREKQKQERLTTDDVYDLNNVSDSSGNEKRTKSKASNKQIIKNASQAIDGEATILKWLQNSDLNKKEGSLDIFKAICNNESDSSDEHDAISPSAGEDIRQRCTKLLMKLQSLKKNLNQLENQVELDVFKFYSKTDDNIQTETDEYNDVNDDDDGDENEEGGVTEKANGQLKKEQKEKDEQHQSIDLLKTTISLMSEAYKEIFDSFKQLNAAAENLNSNKFNIDSVTTTQTTKFQKVKGTSNTNAAMTLTEINEVDDEHDTEDDDEDDDENNDQKSVAKSEVSTIVMKSEQQEQLQSTIDAYQAKVDDLKTKLSEQEYNAQHTLELLQIECDNYKEKINELTSLNEMLREKEHQQQQQLLTVDNVAIAAASIENVATVGVNAASAVEAAAAAAELALANDIHNGDAVSSDSGVSSIDRTIETPRDNDVQVQTAAVAQTDATAIIANFERQMREDLAAIHSTVTQREEELIAYKESLEKTEKENLKLRDQIMQIQQNMDGLSKATLMRYVVPMGIAAFGILAYLLMTYL